MNRLYPRLLPGATARHFEQLQSAGPQPPRGGELPSIAESVYAATGGTRVPVEDLMDIRSHIVRVAAAAGFPDSQSRVGYGEFDTTIARYLHGSLDLTPGEASQRQVWSYFALVLVPDVCAWRYRANETRGYLDDRFVGADLTRHTLARLWLRAHVLHDPGAADPYELLGVLGEADMDQVLARRLDIAATPALVREVVRAHRDDTNKGAGPSDRDILRDSLKRLMRLSAFTNLDGLTRGQLAELVADARTRSRSALSAVH